MNHSINNTTNNFNESDDIQGLYAVVNNIDNKINDYREINFNESIVKIHKKWPLLNEIQNSPTISDQTNIKRIV